MGQKLAVIVVSLVQEAIERSNYELAEEIQEEMKDAAVPWLGRVERVIVFNYEVHHRMPDGKEVKVRTHEV